LLTDTLFAARQLNIKNPKTSPSGKATSPRASQPQTARAPEKDTIKSSSSTFSIASVLTPKVLRTSSISIYENLNRSLTGRGASPGPTSQQQGATSSTADKIEEEKAKPEESAARETHETEATASASVEETTTGETDA
jgi:hypothetical protein